MPSEFDMPEGRGGFHTIRISEPLFAVLQAEAARRDELTRELIHNLLARIAEDNLFAAVLDDGGADV